MAGPVVHFVPLKTFNAVVNGHLNTYKEGEHYHARPGDLWDDLRSKIPKWQSNKLIAVGLEARAEVLSAPVTFARGRASVSNPRR